ncbi:hypothetical protein [Adhaeribacter soli]|uniref:Uncharacterized protein n=1 Tax=Adhaeribacter soli TaxID=2607655 RepID=A0A5N1IXQ7_9BACT|nr:hypothetical protein F0P94_08815 [Adhaeribacter soli]
MTSTTNNRITNNTISGNHYDLFFLQI